MILKKERMRNYINYDYNEDEYEESPVYTYKLNEEEDDEYDEEKNKDFGASDDSIIDNLDKDIPMQPHPTVRKHRKQRATTMNKRKKLDVVYEVGTEVIYKKKKAKVIFGPYEKNYKFVYELQMEDGSITSAIATSVKKA